MSHHVDWLIDTAMRSVVHSTVYHMMRGTSALAALAICTIAILAYLAWKSR